MASNSDAFESFERLTGMMGEFPRIDDRRTGLSYRYGWMLVIDPTKPVEQAMLRQRVLADDEEGARGLFRLQDVEDARRPGRIGAIVEGQRDHARAIAGTLDDRGRRQLGEIDLGDQPVACRGHAPLAGHGDGGNLEDLARALDIDLGTGRNLLDHLGRRQRAVRAPEDRPQAGAEAASSIQKAGVNVQLVAYRGTAPATVDVLAGHIPLAVLDIPASQQLIRDGKLKALGVSAAKRVSFLPEVPPLAELGLTGFESVGWFGLVAPAGTPPEITGKLNAAFVKALKDPAADTNAIIIEALAEATAEAHRAGAIVRRLREFMSRGDLDRHPEAVDRLLEDACVLGLLGAREKGISTAIEIDPSVGLVLIDRVQVQQVLINLLRNAVEALTPMAAGTITVTARPAGGLVEFVIADNGPGLALEVAAQLFKAFVSTKRNGMGLGLSICRTIVEAHGGRIWAETPVGGGTAFHFTVQRIPAEPEHESIRKSVGFTLRSAGYRVQAWASGVAFLKEARALPPGCVLLDVRMPEMDGLALCCRAEASTLIKALDGFWLNDENCYRSRTLVSGERSSKELDIAVILAAIHADARVTCTLGSAAVGLCSRASPSN
eukprot:gene33623-45033_t